MVRRSVDPAPRDALFWHAEAGDRVRCTLCPHRCSVAEGRLGACGVRGNLGGRLLTRVGDRVAARYVDPIEKKPLFHFLPGSTAYSIAAVGCCLRCAYCQNWELAHWARQRPFVRGWERHAPPGERIPPRALVEAARAAGCRSIAYTYTEPTAWIELVLETAARARVAGLANVLVTSGYTAEEALVRWAPLLDAVNVDLKSFRDETYRRVSGGRLAPVLESLRLYRALGVWTEVTTPVVAGLNDSEAELRDLAAFVRSLGEDVPWHLSRVHPAYRMAGAPATPAATLRRAAAIGREAGLRHVYVGNLPGRGGEDTLCHACGAILLSRVSVLLRENRVRDGSCPDCGAVVDGVGMDGPAGGGPRAF